MGYRCIYGLPGFLPSTVSYHYLKFHTDTLHKPYTPLCCLELQSSAYRNKALCSFTYQHKKAKSHSNCIVVNYSGEFQQVLLSQNVLAKHKFTNIHNVKLTTKLFFLRKVGKGYDKLYLLGASWLERFTLTSFSGIWWIQILQQNHLYLAQG